MAKEIVGQIKLQIPAGQANPRARRPGARSAGRQHHGLLQGVQRRHAKAGGRHPSGRHHRLQGQELHLHHKSPPASILIKKAANIAAGSKEPNKQKVAKLSKKQVLDIVKIKMKDLNARDEAAAYRIIAGTARQMGVEVEPHG